MRCALAFIVVLMAGVTGGCASEVKAPTCVGVCYEDAWSREPFTGETKQHIPTVDMRTEEQKQQPEDLNPCKDC